MNKGYTFKEASPVLGVSVSTLFRLMKKGELKTYKIGKSRRITDSEMERIQNG